MAAAAALHTTLHLTTSPSFKSLTTNSSITSPTQFSTINLRPITLHSVHHLHHSRSSAVVVGAFKVLVEHDGGTTELEVEPDETILSKALDSDLNVPHDCKLGVCMTCPAKLLSGKVDQSDGMLSDDVIERGYALMCAAYPRSDCHIRVIPEEELLNLQLATAND